MVGGAVHTLNGSTYFAGKIYARNYQKEICKKTQGNSHGESSGGTIFDLDCL